MSPNSRLSVCDGASIPVIGFGTWPLKDEECARAVAAALACGYRHIDTAEMYANEEAVGQGLRASGVPRDEVWITTKVWWENISDGALQRSAEASLKRLGVDQVDLLLIHWPNKQVPLAESIRALNDAKKRGFARHIGVSNFPSRMLEEALALSEAPLIANQCEYHPYLDQSKVRAVCERNNMASPTSVSITPTWISRRCAPFASATTWRLSRIVLLGAAPSAACWRIRWFGKSPIGSGAPPRRSFCGGIYSSPM